MRDIAPNHWCGLYRPGHTVHFIQARNGWSDEENTPVAGRLLSVSDTGELEIEVAGETLQLWNHEPARLRQLAGRNQNEISYQPSWGLLRTASRDGNYLFCVAELDSTDRVPCRAPLDTSDPLELLSEQGGFLRAADEITKLLRRIDP